MQRLRCLRKLERRGIVARTVLATAPLEVEYTLIQRGQSLKTVFLLLYDWTVSNMSDLETTQREYDLQR